MQYSKKERRKEKEGKKEGKKTKQLRETRKKDKSPTRPCQLTCTKIYIMWVNYHQSCCACREITS